MEQLHAQVSQRMKERAPRNRTLVVHEEEKTALMSQFLVLDAPCSVGYIENRLIHQSLFACVDFLPTRFIDLAIIDPPYNLNKMFGTSKFSKGSPITYEDWLEQWVSKLTRCLKLSASVYICCDWTSSQSVQRVMERHFIVRNRITWEREKGRGALTNWKNCSEDIWFGTLSNDYYLGHRGNEWVKVDHFSLKSEAASRSVPSVGGIPHPASHRHGAA